MFKPNQEQALPKIEAIKPKHELERKELNFRLKLVVTN